MSLKLGSRLGPGLDSGLDLAMSWSRARAGSRSKSSQPYRFNSRFKSKHRSSSRSKSRSLLNSRSMSRTKCGPASHPNLDLRPGLGPSSYLSLGKIKGLWLVQPGLVPSYCPSPSTDLGSDAYLGFPSQILCPARSRSRVNYLGNRPALFPFTHKLF